MNPAYTVFLPRIECVVPCICDMNRDPELPTHAFTMSWCHLNCKVLGQVFKIRIFHPWWSFMWDFYLCSNSHFNDIYVPGRLSPLTCMAYISIKCWMYSRMYIHFLGIAIYHKHGVIRILIHSYSISSIFLFYLFLFIILFLACF